MNPTTAAPFTIPRIARLVLGVVACLCPPMALLAQPALPAALPTTTLTLDATVRFALANNPELAALRQQRGIAAAAVVIAKTYPFNPVYQGSVQYARNDDPTQVTNAVPVTNQVTLEVQLFHQQRYRQQGALAALSRTEWEIAAQELSFSIQAIRAFDGLLYRQGKLALTEEFLKLNQKAADQVKELVESGTLKSGDLLLARSEVLDSQAQIGQNRTAIVQARRDLFRALGITAGRAAIAGTLERPSPVGTCDGWLAAALEMRPERFARQAAITEADADVRFQTADRFGNPQIGPGADFNESKTTFIGLKVQFPIPVFNRRPGEVQQANERRALALLQSRQTDVEIQQDVALATDRLTEARQWVENYRGTILPALRKNLEEMELLFRNGQGGVDLLRVLEVRRKLLRARDGYLDALLTYTQALAELAQAVGDPGLALGGLARPALASESVRQR